MASLLRRLSLICGLLAPAALPAAAGVPISVPPGKPGTGMDEKTFTAAMQDAVTCVAAVLAYRTGEAQMACSATITALPDEALGYKFRGLAYLLEHRFEKAEEDFHAAVRLDPKDPENQAGYAQAMAGQGRFAEAIPRFEAALQIAPTDIRYLAANCWARAGEGSRLDLALRDCNKALQISPQFATALQNRGLVRLKQKSWRAAIRDYSQALTNDGDRPTALFGRGFAHLRVGENAAARADIQAARRLDPEIDDLYILQAVLPAGCRDAGAPCPLPDDLRQPAPSQRPPLLMVSQRPSPFGHPSGLEELDETLRTIELGRLDAMLARTANLLDVRLAPTFTTGWQDAELPQARLHLAEVRLEYGRQQRLACNRKLIGNELCKAPRYGTALAFVTDSASFRREIDQTVDAVQPFWQAVCLASHELTEPCEIE